jgi:hypothetical protein
VSLLDLTNEHVTYIFGFLRAKDLCRMAQVSKRFKELANNNTLWKYLVLQDWKLPNPRTKDWKKYYEKRYRSRKEKLRLKREQEKEKAEGAQISKEASPDTKNNQNKEEEEQQDQQRQMAPGVPSKLTLQEEGLAMLRRPNYLINGKWRLLSKLGSGSFGEIYQGINVDDNERLAIKLV